MICKYTLRKIAAQDWLDSVAGPSSLLGRINQAVAKPLVDAASTAPTAPVRAGREAAAWLKSKFAPPAVSAARSLGSAAAITGSMLQNASPARRDLLDTYAGQGSLLNKIYNKLPDNIRGRMEQFAQRFYPMPREKYIDASERREVMPTSVPFTRPTLQQLSRPNIDLDKLRSIE